MDIRLTPKQIAWFFAGVTGCLLLVHVGFQTLRFVTGDRFLLGLGPLFNLGAERSLPTYYSVFALLFAALLLAAITVATRAAGQGWTRHWAGLSAIFVLLSVDEMLELHEELIEPVRSLLHTGGVFYYAWIIPYGLALLMLAVVYLGFLRALPRRTAALFVVGGAIFVGGGIGLEMLGGVVSETWGNDNPTYVAMQTIEETLEMAGIVVFIYALADYMATRFGGLRVRIGHHDDPVTTPRTVDESRRPH